MARGVISRFVADAVVVIGPVVVGAIGLIWPEELAKVGKGVWSPPAWIFTASFVSVSAVAIWSIKIRRDDEARNAGLFELGQRAAFVATTMRMKLKDLRDAQDVEPAEAIRLVLWGIADAVYRFAGREDAYGTNVMLFQEARPSIPVRFAEADAPVRGFLVIRRELSTCRPGRPGASDDALEEFALPVPKAGDRCLPGAPLAFSEDRPRFYPDFRKMLHWCRTHGFDGGIQRELEDYFKGKGSLVRCMISTPLSSDGLAPFAVFNLHRAQVAEMLHDPEHVLEFIRKIEPMLELLTEELAAAFPEHQAGGDDRASEG